MGQRRAGAAGGIQRRVKGSAHGRRYCLDEMPFRTLSATRPGPAVLKKTLETQCDLPVTFSGPLEPTPGFRFTRVLEPLGGGPNVFMRAVLGLEAWAVYPAWMTLYPHPAPLDEGVCVALVAGIAPVWTVSAVRIVSVERSVRHLAFTLQTLPQHALTGSERFCIYRDEQDRVFYELTALSRPQHPLAKLGAPAVQLVQRRFARDSVRSLQRFIRTDSDPTGV